MSYGDSEASTYDGPTEGAVMEREAKAARLARQKDGHPPVEKALERCDEAATRVLELAENLHNRLTPVLGPERPEPAMGEVRSDDDYSPLASHLEALADRLTDAAAQLLRTTRRIEL